LDTHAATNDLIDDVRSRASNSLEALAEAGFARTTRSALSGSSGRISLAM
jgi:hypothetical protein